MIKIPHFCFVLPLVVEILLFVIVGLFVRIDIELPLALKGVLASGSAYARPSALPQRKYVGAHVRKGVSPFD